MSNNIENKIYEILSKEDEYVEISGDKNPFKIDFKDNTYLLHFSKIHSYYKKPNMRRIQIDADLKTQFLKYYEFNYICGIFGYDENTDTISTWSTSYLDTEFKSGKSLYTTINSIEDATDKGISKYHIKENYQNYSIHFQSKYLPYYLTQYSDCQKNIENKIIEFKGFEKHHIENDFHILEDKITKLHFQLYPDLEKKISNRWINEEFLLVYDLYLKLKKGLIKDQANDPSIIKTFNIMRKISSIENIKKRTLGSIYMAIQNYKSVDDKWPGKGLSGGNKLISATHEKFKDDEVSFYEELNKIYKKYNINININNEDGKNLDNIKDNKNFPIIKEHTPGNLDFKNLNVTSIDLNDQIEIQNLKDRASKLHIFTVDYLAEIIRSKNLIPLEDRNSFDLFVKEDQLSKIFEIKSLSNENFVTQIRSAIIQIQEYIFTHSQIYKTDGFDINIQKFIVFHDNPKNYTSEKTINKYFLFAEKLKINILWLENGEIKNSINSLMPW